VTFALHFHEIVSLSDSLYDPWLDLYQTAFPLNEQMLVSAHNKILRDKGDGLHPDQHFLAALDTQQKLLAMARYDLMRECQAAILWYLAVRTDERSQGIGGQVYQYIMQHARREYPSLRALTYEVEDPDVTQEREWALRRIAFYQRNGARLLEGIHYDQAVGWQPPVSMKIMVHPYEEMNAEQAFILAKRVYGDALQKVGPLILD